MKKNATWFLIVAIAMSLAMGCGSSSTSSSSSTSGQESGLELATNSAKSTPQIVGSLLNSNLAPLNIGVMKTVASEALNQIESFFKLECHTDNGSLNFCPSGVDSTSLDTKFSTTTLIGLVQHADMYLSNIYSMEQIVDPETGESTETPTYKTCGRGETSSALTEHTPVYTPTNANTFVVDFGTLYDCVGTFNFVEKTSYALYSKAEDNLHFAALTSRKEDNGSVGDVTYTPSDIFQSYVKRDSTGAPVILAFNLASYSNYPNGGGALSGQRAILLTNMATNRFVVKYIMGTPEDTFTDHFAELVAIGTAGYNPSTSSWVSGNYLVKSKFHDDGAVMTCVQNGETPTVLDGPTSTDTWDSATTNCTDTAEFFSAEGWDFSVLLAWLSADPSDIINLDGFSGFFDNNNDFLSSEATITPADGTTYYPDSITN